MYATNALTPTPWGCNGSAAAAQPAAALQTLTRSFRIVSCEVTSTYLPVSWTERCDRRQQTRTGRCPHSD